MKSNSLEFVICLLEIPAVQTCEHPLCYSVKLCVIARCEKSRLLLSHFAKPVGHDLLSGFLLWGKVDAVEGLAAHA